MPARQPWMACISPFQVTSIYNNLIGFRICIALCACVQYKCSAVSSCACKCLTSCIRLQKIINLLYPCMTELKSANNERSACRERLQRSRTQQLQCTTVSQHSMYSYIVEPGRQRCDQHIASPLGLGRRSRKTLAVLQSCALIEEVLSHGATRSRCLHAMEWNEQLRLSIETITLHGLVPRSAPHVSRRGR